MIKRNLVLISSFLFILLINISCEKDNVKNTFSNNEKVIPSKNVFCIDNFHFNFAKDRKINTFPNGMNVGNIFPKGNTSNIFLGNSNSCLVGTWVSNDVFCNNIHDVFYFYSNGTGAAILIQIVQGECIPRYATMLWMYQNGLLYLHLEIPELGLEMNEVYAYSCPSNILNLNGFILTKQ